MPFHSVYSPKENYYIIQQSNLEHIPKEIKSTILNKCTSMFTVAFCTTAKSLKQSKYPSTEFLMWYINKVNYSTLQKKKFLFKINEPI